ncbi:S41 family peptidase [Piscinibacter sakaiensis]|uniref:Nisin-resistance protein n=1 Tax=Piscinibacter sakaiensis TaxID=1547922 RepID=A0A0K8P6N3_PISS1|nr:S41 family peptidase [Piscinibacter sakaiensis]GAP38277.1 nisin-resistance protein [Piscinibacter sakaiensis]
MLSVAAGGLQADATDAWVLSGPGAMRDAQVGVDGVRVRVPHAGALSLPPVRVAAPDGGAVAFARLAVQGDAAGCVRLRFDAVDEAGQLLPAARVDGSCLPADGVVRPVALVAERPAGARELRPSLVVTGDAELRVQALRAAPARDARALLAEAVAAPLASLLDEVETRVRARMPAERAATGVDWPLVRARAWAAALGLGPRREEALPAVRAFMRALGDGHSGAAFVDPSGRFRDGAGEGLAQARPQAEILRQDGSAVLRLGLPPMLSLAGADAADYAGAIRAGLREAQRAGVCAVVLDLRGHTGGNMWPGLDGLAPLLGAGEVGAFRPGPPWVIGDEQARLVGAEAPAGVPAPAAWPVAVLIGPRTASSGEAVAIAFSGRGGSRFFGQRSRGLATSNAMIDMGEGLVLFLMTSRMVDRDGRAFPRGLQPDEAADDAAVLPAATAWLRSQGAPCSARAAPPG